MPSSQIPNLPSILEWSAKQGRVLTSNNEALTLYTAERGFPYKDEELPHYYKVRGLARQTFEVSADDC